MAEPGRRNGETPTQFDLAVRLGRVLRKGAQVARVLPRVHGPPQPSKKTPRQRSVARPTFQARR